jgi:hypothetical protein
MKQRIDRPIRSTSSQIVWVCLALTSLGIAVALSIVTINGMLNGCVNSPTAYGLPTKLIYKNTSPHLYWSFIVFYLLSVALILIIAIGLLREAVMEQKRKTARQKKGVDANIQREGVSQ